MFDSFLIGLESFSFVFQSIWKIEDFIMDLAYGLIFVFFGSHLGVIRGPLGRHGDFFGQRWAFLERMENAKGPKSGPQMA